METKDYPGPFEAPCKEAVARSTTYHLTNARSDRNEEDGVAAAVVYVDLPRDECNE